MNSDRRRSPRMRHLEFVLYETPSVRSEGHLGNASEHGLFIRAEELPKTGEAVRVELRRGPALVLVGEVCWTSAERGREGDPGFGVHLTSAPPGLADLLRRRRRRRSGPH